MTNLIPSSFWNPYRLVLPTWAWPSSRASKSQLDLALSACISAPFSSFRRPASPSSHLHLLRRSCSFNFPLDPSKTVPFSPLSGEDLNFMSVCSSAPPIHPSAVLHASPAALRRTTGSRQTHRISVRKSVRIKFSDKIANSLEQMSDRTPDKMSEKRPDAMLC